MNGWDDQPTGILGPSRLASLPAAERTVLAALAVVGRASLSSEELAALVEVSDIRPLVDDLERRGLLRREDEHRYSLVGRIGADIRRLDETIETADRLIGYLETLTRGGKLTAARLEQDAEAILGIAAWGAEVQRWESVLELVKTVQAAFGLAKRFHEQRVLFELGREAARHLGDRAAELFFLQQLEQVAARLGDETARVEFRYAAKAVRRGGGGIAKARTVLQILALVTVGAAGAVGGEYLGSHTAGATTTLPAITAHVTVTVTGRGSTTTVVQQGATVTATVQSVTTSVVSTTVTEPTTVTTTVTTTPAPPK